MRAFRFGLGLLIIVVVLWIIVGEQISGASANAFINARLTTVRSPIAGEVAFETDTLGARVAPQEIVATVQDRRSDQVRRNDLALETALQATEIAMLASLRTRMEERLLNYREARIAEMEVALEHARTRLEILRSADGEEMPDALVAEVVDEDTRRTRGEPLTYPLALDYTEQRVETLENTLAAAREDGVFLGDGYNDAPYAEQRLNELKQEETDLRTRLQQARAKQSARDLRLEQARASEAKTSGASLASPVEGVIWEFRSASGETVQRGDPVATLADCGSTFVSLSVTESVYNSLELGQPATFRPSGSQSTFRGTVSRLAGSAALTIYRNLAVVPGPRHLERYDVTLLVPGLAADPEYGCAIGRTGRAFFEKRPLDWLRGLGS